MKMANISKEKNGYYLNEPYREKGKVKNPRTYLGTKPPLAKSRGWTNLSPEIIKWLKERAKQKTRATRTLPEQKGKYQTIVVDPPWPMTRINIMIRRQENPFDYPTMTLSQIKNDRKVLPIRRLMNKAGCFVFLWTTQKFLPDAYNILGDWGFKYLFTMVWLKRHGMQPFNLPTFDCEFVVVGRRGSINFLDLKSFKTTFGGKRRNHSQKPKEFYKLLKRIAPAPRIDMFSREKHRGFDQFGNETGKFDAKNQD